LTTHLEMNIAKGLNSTVQGSHLEKKQMPRKQGIKRSVKPIRLSLEEYRHQWDYLNVVVDEEKQIINEEKQIEDLDLALSLQEQEDFEYAKKLNETLPKNLQTFIPREENDDEDKQEEFICTKYTTKQRNAYINRFYNL